MASKVLLLASLASPGFSFPTKLHPRWDNGLAQTPPMGWNSYNHYNCAPNESIIMSNAQALVDLGLADLGYDYATTDCGWTIPHRTANGTLTWNETLFPSGFPAMGEFIHELGLKFGVYSDAGVQMCMTGGVNQTGSLYHEQTDADTFSAWGADLLKYDNCYSEISLGYPNTDYDPPTSPAPRYNAMKQALINTGRSILYQICDWGVDFPSAWAPELGNTWRVTNDIIPQWRTVYRIVNQVVPQTSFAGPHQWLDLDMLEVGNNVFTTPEEQTHFSLWAILKSPLVIGAALKDTLTSINPASLEILKNKDVIALNQDSLGISANLTRRWSDAGFDVWSGLLSGNRTVAALVNWNNSTLNATLDLPDLGFQRAGYIKDIWNNATSKDVQTSYTKVIPAHGTLLLELGETEPVGYYPIKVDHKNGNTTTISNVYGITTSASYKLSISFTTQKTTTPFTIEIKSSASSTPITHIISTTQQPTTLLIPLAASNKNTLQITSPYTLASLLITPPDGTFYPSPDFTTSGTAVHTTCTTGLCAPVGSKIGYITPNGSASISIPRNSSSSTATFPSSSSSLEKYVEIVYINNDVSLDTSWTTGRNSRNITVRVNDGPVARLEVPLSGRSSELFSPMKGWGDSAALGLLVGGWGDVGEEGVDVVTVGNEGGEDGVQSYGADFVGLTVL